MQELWNGPAGFFATPTFVLIVAGCVVLIAVAAIVQAGRSRPVRLTPPPYATPVAHPNAAYVVAGVLHFFRGLDVAVDQQRESRWDKGFFVSDESPIREVSGARVLIVGDSISIGYTPPAAKLLEGKANIHHNPGNASDTVTGVKNLNVSLEQGYQPQWQMWPIPKPKDGLPVTLSLA